MTNILWSRQGPSLRHVPAGAARSHPLHHLACNVTSGKLARQVTQLTIHEVRDLVQESSAHMLLLSPCVSEPAMTPLCLPMRCGPCWQPVFLLAFRAPHSCHLQVDLLGAGHSCSAAARSGPSRSSSSKRPRIDSIDNELFNRFACQTSHHLDPKSKHSFICDPPG